MDGRRRVNEEHELHDDRKRDEQMTNRLRS
jgi:hypothetical protein